MSEATTSLFLSMSHSKVVEEFIEEVKNDHSDLACCKALERLCAYVDDLFKENTTIVPANITDELQNLAVILWNIAVAKKTGNNLEKNANAKLRHCSCLLSFQEQNLSSNPVLLKRQIMMAIKTSRAWIDSDNPMLADTSLNWAMQSIEKFKSFLENEVSDSTKSEMEELQRNMFKMLTYRVESACLQGKTETALEALQSAKDLIPIMPKEAPYLCVMCYNAGCEGYKKKDYNTSAMWLRESVELGKSDHSIGSENQAKTLRLLATVYIDWDIKQYMQKALNAVGLANAEYCHPVGLYLKLQILLKGDYTDSRIQSALDDIIRHSDLGIDTAIQTVNLLATNTRFDLLAFDACKKLTRKFEGSHVVGQIVLLHLDMLLERNMNQPAKDMIEDFLTGPLNLLDIDIKTRLHIVLWSKAADSFEKTDYNDSLTWYNYSLSLFSSDKGSKNLAKLQRNRASCFLALNNISKAEETIEEAAKHDGTNSYTYFLMYKVALMKGQDSRAIESVKKMCEEKNDKSLDNITDDDITDDIIEVTSNDEKEPEGEVQNKHGLICIAAQLAFEKSNRVVAVKALEALVSSSRDTTQVLTAIRCLVRLKVTLMEGLDDKKCEYETILSYLKTAVSKILILSKDTSSDNQLVTRESTWFMKIAWNLALQCTEENRLVNCFFTLCSEFSSFGEEDAGSLVRQKTCHLMSAASCLQAARDTTNKTEKMDFLSLALNHVNDCQRISQKLPTGDRTAKDNTAVLMLLYEFEALARLGQADKLMGVLEKAAALPYKQTKTFETIAGLCMATSIGYKDVALKALDIAFQMHIWLTIALTTRNSVKLYTV
ncbi:testis-expressed protein 11-like [Antedon mediterranea]|uniref:testis-expressed protein 11-like n=1 Tax=Antedon mediterranea TaxID=105859 RepID=UPI003AF78F5C